MEKKRASPEQKQKKSITYKIKRMKTKFFRCSLMALATTAFLASCSQDEVLNTVPEQNEQTITVTASSLNFKAADVQTRVSENGVATVFETNDQMGLYVVENYSDTENAKIILRNIPLTYQDGKWTADRNIYYYKNADYIAYFPYKADLAANIAPTEVETQIKKTFDDYLTANQTDQSLKETYRNADLMMAKIEAADLAAQPEGTKLLNFVLKHQYSMIEVAIPTHKYYYQAGDNQINFDVPMTDFILTVANSEINPYHLGEGVYRCLVTPGEINVEGSFTDPKDLRPVEFNNTKATTKSLTAGAYVRYNIGFTNAPDATRTERNIIGDYFCQDGTIFPSDFQDLPTNVIGIIYAKVGENDFTAEQAGKYSHYVLSIKERKDINFKVPKEQSPTNDSKVNIAGIPNIDSSNETDFKACLDEMAGFTSTATLNALSYNITTDLTSNWKGSFAPAGDVATSGWFIPSMGQWGKLQEILKSGEVTYAHHSSTPKLTCNTEGQVNTTMVSLLEKLNSSEVSKTFKGCYWSLTQTQEVKDGDKYNSKLYCLDISESKFEVVLQEKTAKRILRPILAF